MKELAPKCDLVLVIGSQNSSNSRRLVEIAENRGVKAHLVDDVSQISRQWFDGVDTVLITAGASAPEDLVTALIDFLQTSFDAAVEQYDITSEDVHFELPTSLKKLELLKTSAV